MAVMIQISVSSSMRRMVRLKVRGHAGYQASHLGLNEMPELLETKLQPQHLVPACQVGLKC